jgi:Zn-dependent protease
MTTDIALGLTSYVVLLFSLSFHESAHAWMASRLGDDTAREQGRVSLNPIVHMELLGTVILPLLQIFGPQGIPLLAWAKPTPYDPSNFKPGYFRRGHVLVAGAGPISNLILAGVFTATLFVVRWTLPYTEATDPMYRLVMMGVVINVLLALFNLVPLPPLDGSKVASFGLPRVLGELYDKVVVPYGAWILLLLVVTGGFRFVSGPVHRLVNDALRRIAFS